MLAALGFKISLFLFVNIISCVLSVQYGSGTLYVDRESTKTVTVFNRDVESGSVGRTKRDATTVPPPLDQSKKLDIWTTHLNDSHQQLMVHWVGEGSNVIICLARDSTTRNKGALSPSALYISYDYGKNFTNKTENFRLGDSPDSGYAQLDKFFNHPKYPEFCVFVDSANKKLYYTTNNGQIIQRTDLDFHPSDLVFDEDIPNRYVILDKINSTRNLYMTSNGGRTFHLVQNYVKTFTCSSGVGLPKTFYVERWKPGGNSTVFSVTDFSSMDMARELFSNAKDFQIKGDFMFATKQSKEKNSLELYISHRRGPFFKAEFQTELDLTKFHIADVTDNRIFVSVLHTENMANLYVSEISKNFTQYNFVLSLEQVLCYFPDGNWKDSWLEDVTEDPFTDLYRVEGLKGIYIASKVNQKTQGSNIEPDHLISLITFDHGATWSPITPPTEDENGKPLNCHIENSCSLHLCQKFSQLYPVTRSASIMSSKSVPGIIMATGVLGKSLKGIPGVYISRDAGLTWKRILKDYYFFNYGDHGGVLVAVKYFKTRGETKQILYSTNEGMDWNSYQFNTDDLRIYGLMTEPGENTTTFTMFGSANEQHQWIIITIDLLNGFQRNCNSGDYKYWAPTPPNPLLSCVLGLKDNYMRRLAHANCRNGVGFMRTVAKERCECGRQDYECDFGFVLSHNLCVRNQSLHFDPFAVPPDCRPGMFYNRTKGYRKIDGDICTISYYMPYEPQVVPCPIEEPQEFMLVALRDKIARIDLSDNSTLIAVQDQKNIVAIEFDMKNNCIYWADIELDKISRQCFGNGNAQEVVVDTDLASIEGMALDWISNVLFFVDGMRKKIEAVRTDLNSKGRLRATILDSTYLSKPRGIAVHPKAGYLYWTDWDRSSPSVSRSNLDGTNVKRLFTKPIVQWPNGITIDQMADRIYWVDAMEDYIASADLNGQYFIRILWNDEKVAHPFAVAVLKNKMYWDDWKTKSIFMADKDTGANIITINDTLSGLMDLKVFAYFMQHGSNACSYKNTSCETLCLGGPGNSFSCLCPDGFKKVNGKCMCPNGLEPTPNMTCPKQAGSCSPEEFTCKNGMCITSTWRCDRNDDCGDFSDEEGCMCSPPMLACSDGKCYLPSWRCDGDADCADMSDERGCGHHNCTETQFQCANGNCIQKRWLCDGDNDCRDGSDERNCTQNQPKRPDTIGCHGGLAFECNNTSGHPQCIPNSWICDGERDCPDGEDESEERCRNSTCAPYMFRCPTGKCIYMSWVCDGENDCSDIESSDEKNCSSIGHSKLIPRPTTPVPAFPHNGSCLDWMFKCDNGNCLPYWWRCDGINDCGDNSDELLCGSVVPEKPIVKPEHDATKYKCSKNHFTCAPGVCIPLSWVCDSMPDCTDGADERNCMPSPGPTLQCSPDSTFCADGQTCVRNDQLCDGVPQCADRSDEAYCGGKHKNNTYCPSRYFQCDDGMKCLWQVKVCNGHQDCYDGSDEANCTNEDKQTFYSSISIGVDQSSINSTSFLISCWVPQQKLNVMNFLPSISKVGDTNWKNMTWTNESIYRFTDLEPYTEYNVTVYIEENRSKKVYRSDKYVTTMTGEGLPSPPRRLTVRQMVGSRINVIWDPPAEPNGVLHYYTVYYVPPLPPMEKIISAREDNNPVSVVLEGFFKPDKNYSFWVTATNGLLTSDSTEIATITFDDVSDVDDIVNASMAWLSPTSVSLRWHKLRGIEGYMVQTRLPSLYKSPDVIKTQENSVNVTNLPPGVTLSIDIKAYKNTTIGEPFTIPLKTDGIPDEALNLTAMLLKEKGTSVQLSWTPLTSERYKNKELVYEVYYVKLPEWKVNGTELTTKGTSVLIEGLHACESYVFSVRLLGGPASMRGIITRENPRAPIKDLHFEYDEKKAKLNILWRANCDVIQMPVAYRLDITELTHNKVSRFELKPSEDVTLSHLIEGIPFGGRFNICVFTAEKDSVQTCSRFRSGEIHVPYAVLAWMYPSGHIMISWQSFDDNNPTLKYKYQILLSEEEIPDDLINPGDEIKSAVAEFSPYIMYTDSVPNGPMYVGVRAVNEEGYFSDMNEVLTIEGSDSLEFGSDAEWSAGAIWWGAGAACIVALALSGVLLHVVLRHRRLSNSLLRLAATPRYDSRRGQATIDHDDDDVPPIHGFSDDEPLVIA